MVDKITDLKLRIIGIYRSDYLASYHIREMARMIRVSHVTILPHIASLENERVIEAKEKGKNKAFSLNLANMLTKEYLIIAEKYEAMRFLGKIFLLKQIYSEILSIGIDCPVIVFGSYAKSNFTGESDIDIEILDILGDRLISRIKQIGKVYGKEISVRASKAKSFEESIKKHEALAWEIINGHIILQGADAFVSILWRYFNESRPIGMVQEAKERIKAGAGKRNTAKSVL